MAHIETPLTPRLETPLTPSVELPRPGIPVVVLATEPPPDCSALSGDLSRFTLDQQRHYSLVLQQQGRVALDADWNEQQYLHRRRTELEAADVIGRTGAPRAGSNFRVQLGAGGDLMLGPGRIYVDGILCENHQDASYLHQPFLLDPPALDRKNDYVVYLDVWRRHVTALDDPHIREIALDGPDTATREQIVWQLRAVPIDPADLHPGQLASCGMDSSAYAAATAASNGRLNARTRPPQPTDDICVLPPTAGYQRLENQLYRVEVHAPGALGDGTTGAPTFVWSRDNGMVIAPIAQMNGTKLTLTTLGHDADTGFPPQTIVEVIDDRRAFDGLPGDLATVVQVDPAQRILTLDASIAAIDPALNPRVRRWDGTATAAIAKDDNDTSWLPLESGIQINFVAGTYRTGDFWQIPARTASGAIEWPPFGAPAAAPLPQPKLGVRHHYCRLALVHGGDKPTITDCRPLFDPLTVPATHIVATEWRNDDVLDLATFFERGLALSFDAPQITVSDASIRVFADIPLNQNVSRGSFAPFATESGPLTAGGTPVRVPTVAVELPGTIHVEPPSQPAVLPVDGLARGVGSALRWIPDPPAHATLDAHAQAGLRCRVEIKGETLWSFDGRARAYLDGTALCLESSRAAGNLPSSAQRFPSGIGRAASDYASWFFVQQAQTLLKVTRVQFLNPNNGIVFETPFPPGATNPAIVVGASFLQITFSERVNPAGFAAAPPHAIVIDGNQVPGGTTTNLALSPDGTVATVTLIAPTGGLFVYPPGGYRLRVVGKADSPAVVAATAADGEPLDGAENNTPGSDFVFPFSITPGIG